MGDQDNKISGSKSMEFNRFVKLHLLNIVFCKTFDFYDS